MTSIKQVIKELERIAPPVYQESYDNAGLIVGDASKAVTGVLVCLDSTEAIIEEAKKKGCNLVVAHHPIVFKGLKRFTGSNYVERTVIKAIQEGIAIYAIHTNLDNMYHQGVNARFAERLGLQNTHILTPKPVFEQWSASTLSGSLNTIHQALLEAGAEEIQIIEHRTIDSEKAVKLSFKVPFGKKRELQQILSQHGAYLISKQALHDLNLEIGSGMWGMLPRAMEEKDFLQFLKDQMQTDCIKHTALRGKPIQKVALCGGAGGFLLKAAIRNKADIFITSDYKYHEYFDADGRIIIADIGHYESEQFTIPLLEELLSNKFSTFAVYKTELRTNPVSYFV